jgi:hypothetical protein
LKDRVVLRNRKEAIVKDNGFHDEVSVLLVFERRLLVTGITDGPIDCSVEVKQSSVLGASSRQDINERGGLLVELVKPIL